MKHDDVFLSLGAVGFWVEVALAVSFCFTAIPLASRGAPLLNLPWLLAFVTFGGYVWLGLGCVLYTYGAIAALVGKQTLFWNSLTPSILGLPIFIWGVGKSALSIGTFGAAAAALFALAIGTFLWHRTGLLRFRILPLLLIAGFLMLADIPNGWVYHVIAGAVLLSPALSVTARFLKTAASKAPG